MAELFMECEEEELEPWQQKEKAIVVDDDDDDEPIFVGEILSSKPTNTYILNRVNPSSSRMGMQNGAPKRGAVQHISPGVGTISAGFQSATRPATSTLAVQPQPRVGNISGASQRPLSDCSSPQEAVKSSAEVSPPIGRSATVSSLSRNLNISVVSQSASRPVATVTAQPVVLNRVIPNNSSGITFGLRQNSGALQYQSGSVGSTTGLSKRLATSEVNTVTPKKAKASETGSESDLPVSPSFNSQKDSTSLKGITTCSVKNGAPFPQACPKCNIHFNLLDPLKNHMKYCCPDMVHSFLGVTKADCSGPSAKTAEMEKGKLIMLVNDFYYGKQESAQMHQEQKTHTTFKCGSCMKLLKNNIRFMNHMKHHLELEKQNSESWESHTTCQHCYRQFPTPFQLQCHIESTHTPYESSTICKICELSFESEQVLLQHMKDNHKPGEMPYVCQVCNYRSSVFSDVEKHFRTIHENTKNLLCPFCLKVIKVGAPFMHHYMRHQKKGVHRCTNCRLQFLTCKEKMDHKAQHHRTFRKPVQLEGLPPGTKVTIRASLGSLHPGSLNMISSVSTSTSPLQLPPSVKEANTKNHTKSNVNKAKHRLKPPPSVQKKQSPGSNSSSQSSNGSSSSSSSSSSSKQRNNKIANTALSNLRCSEIQKCIECYSDIRTFASHFPAYVRCSLCRYNTSCSKAYVNHMMSFHSARQSKRFWIYKTHSEDLRGVTLVCLNCDFLTDASSLDKMATHLNDNHDHTCQVVIENAPLDPMTAEDLSDLVSHTAVNHENAQETQKTSRSSTPERHKEKSMPESPQMRECAEETNKDLGNQRDEACSDGKLEENICPSTQDNSSSPGSHVMSKDPMDSAGIDETGNLGIQVDGGSSEEMGNLGIQSSEVTSAAECKEKTSLSVLENSPAAELQSRPTDSIGPAEAADRHTLENGIKETSCEGNPSASTLEGPSVLEIKTYPKDSMEEATRDNPEIEVKEEASAAENKASASPSIAEKPYSDPDLHVCSKDRLDSAEEAMADNLEKEASDASLVANCEGSAAVSTVEACSTSEHQICSRDTAEEATRDNLGNHDGDESKTSASPIENPLGIQAHSAETSCERTENDDRLEEKTEKPINETKTCQSPREVLVPSGGGDDANQRKVAERDETGLEDMDGDNLQRATDDEVSFEQFLRRRDEPESASSDLSEQGSIHLEPLTPSEVLEHEATEILQKGGVASSSKKAGPVSEQTDHAASRESSPSHTAASENQTEGSSETS